MVMKKLFRDIKNRIEILQHEEEILWAVDRIRIHLGKPATSFVEFGSYTGGSFTLFAKTLTDEDAVLLAFDSHGVAFDHSGVKEFLGRDYSFHSISSLESGDIISEVFRKRKIDLLHIDSIHLAAHTEKEWAIVKPYMNSPSVAVIHDIKPGCRHSDCSGYLGYGVKQLSTGDWFQRIKFDYSYEEKSIDNLSPEMGIGLLLL